MRNQTDNFLSQLQILEFGKNISTAYCAVTLAKLGADVIKIERRGNDTHELGIQPNENRERNGMDPMHLALNHTKRSARINLETSRGRKTLKQLLIATDLVIDDGTLSQYATSIEEVMIRNPSLVIVSILPFRPGHIYDGYVTSDLSLFQMSGNAHGIIGPVENPNVEPPIRAGGQQTEMVSGLTAATAAMIGIHRKLRTGNGCNITVSKFESIVTMAISGLANQAFGKPAPSRKLSDQKESSIGGMVSAIGGVLPCKNGFVAISPREDSQWERWLDLMGRPDWSTDERFNTRSARQENVSALWDLLSKWSQERSKFDIAKNGQDLRIPCFPVNTLSDLMVDPHLDARDFFVEIEHPTAGHLRYPGNPFKVDGRSTSFNLDAAPNPGQHNKDFNIE